MPWSLRTPRQRQVHTGHRSTMGLFVVCSLFTAIHNGTPSPPMLYKGLCDCVLGLSISSLYTPSSSITSGTHTSCPSYLQVPQHKQRIARKRIEQHQHKMPFILTPMPGYSGGSIRMFSGELTVSYIGYLIQASSIRMALFDIGLDQTSRAT